MSRDLKVVCADFIKKTGTDIIVVAAKIETPATAAIRKLCARETGRDKLLLILTTPGGQADDAFRIARALRRRYEKITLLIHSECKSAGTLLALVADELVMSDSGELGPLDVQLERQTEIAGAPQSGLDLNQSFRVLEENMLQTFRAHLLDIRIGARLSTKVAADIACHLTSAAYRSIYEQIDPLRLGEIHRKTVIANEYGDRIASHNVKEDAVTDLVSAYPSHGFVIDREEAENHFHTVRVPTADELAVLNLLPPYVFELQYEKVYIFGVEPHEDNSAKTDDDDDDQNGDESREAPVAPASAGVPERDAGTPGDPSVDAKPDVKPDAKPGGKPANP